MFVWGVCALCLRVVCVGVCCFVITFWCVFVVCVWHVYGVVCMYVCVYSPEHC